MKSHLEYLFEKGLIPMDQIILTEGKDDEGQKIAKTLGIRLAGWWEELSKYLFNDDEDTGTSFAAANLDEAKKKLAEVRAAFAKAKEMKLANA